jgi:hypothetical protein
VFAIGAMGRIGIRHLYHPFLLLLVLTDEKGKITSMGILNWKACFIEITDSSRYISSNPLGQRLTAGRLWGSTGRG